MVPFLVALSRAISDKKVAKYLHDNNRVLVSLPFQPFNWTLFIGKAKLFFKSNFMLFMNFLSGAITLFHYEQIVNRFGKSNKRSCMLTIIEAFTSG